MSAFANNLRRLGITLTERLSLFFEFLFIASNSPKKRLDNEVEYRQSSIADKFSQSSFAGFEDERKGITVVELFKVEGSGLGLTITGGADKGDRARITGLRPGSIAHRSDALQYGDVIVCVNGIRTSNLRHEEVVNLLKNADERVILEVEYNLPELPPRTFSMISKRVEILLEKDGRAFGFTMRGGMNQERTQCHPLVVTQIRPGSAADREGSLKVSDRILAINGISVNNCTLDEAIALLKRSDAEAVILAEYDVSVVDDTKNIQGPLLIDIDKNPGAGLGMTLTSSVNRGKSSICIENIRPASIADRCGALHVGDHILAIDGTSLEHMSISEASQLLKSCVGEHIKLEVLPQSQTKLSRLPPPPVPQRQGSVLSSHSTPYTSCNSLYSAGSGGSASHYSSTQGQSQGQGYQNQGNYMNVNHLRRPPPSKPRRLSGGSSSGNEVPCLIPGAQVCHPETAEVTLQADEQGLGLVVHGGVFSTADTLNDAPVIEFIDPGGPADRCGCLQEGDRLVSINGLHLECRTVAEVNRMLREPFQKPILETEFDVADAVIPSSGIFNVTLRKRGTTLGITISAPKNRIAGEPLFISNIKRGSVAHRTGTIHAGDLLLAIDSLKTEDLSLEDAASILQNVEEIVKLRIKKEERYIDDCNEDWVSYTVELQRHGGPLGLTISGSEEPFDPIVISALIDGGLAERTGALHVADRILSINNKSLHGRPFSDAVATLQSAGEFVTLKISRPVETANTGMRYLQPPPNTTTVEVHVDNYHSDRISTPVTSADSALDSWDSQDGSRPRLRDSSNHGIAPHHCPPGRIHSRDSAVSAESDWESGTASSCRNSASTDQDDWMRTIDELQENSDMLNRLEAALKAKRQHGLMRIEEDFLKRCRSNDSRENLKNLATKYSEMDIMKLQQQIQSINAPTPTELFKVTLYKNSDTDNFGFSLSDGLIEKGVYISELRPEGPAEKCGVLRPFDRILQVNHIKTRDLDCCLVVPLIASSGNQLDLVVSRNPLAQHEIFGDTNSICSGDSQQTKTMYKCV